jgi:hypothetical protein
VDDWPTSTPMGSSPGKSPRRSRQIGKAKRQRGCKQDPRQKLRARLCGQAERYRGAQTRPKPRRPLFAVGRGPVFMHEDGQTAATATA